MTQIRDHLVILLPEKLEQHFSDLQNRLLDAWGDFPVSRRGEDSLGLVSTKLIKFTADQIPYLYPLLFTDIDQYLWRTRSIMECSLILDRIATDSSLAKVFSGQKIRDEVEILEGMCGLRKDIQAGDFTEPIRERTKLGRSLLTKHGLTYAAVKQWNMRDIAKAIKREDEYVAFYKLTSKYAHPSAWRVLSDDDEYAYDELWQIGIIYVQECIYRILATSERLTKGRTKSTRHGREILTGKPE